MAVIKHSAESRTTPATAAPFPAAPNCAAPTSGAVELSLEVLDRVVGGTGVVGDPSVFGQDGSAF